MKPIITTSIVVITILHVTDAIAENRNECLSGINTEYLAIVNNYRSTGKCTFSGGRLQALHDKVCECVTSGKPVASACAAAQEICCGTSVDYVVTGTTNNVQTCTKHAWNAATQTCSTSTIYRCAIGYYGTPTTASSGCSQCPPWGGIFHNSGLSSMAWGTTAAPGQTAVTGCYIPTGTYFDTAGTFQLTSTCSYKS